MKIKAQWYVISRLLRTVRSQWCNVDIIRRSNASKKADTKGTSNARKPKKVDSNNEWDYFPMWWRKHYEESAQFQDHILNYKMPVTSLFTSASSITMDNRFRSIKPFKSFHKAMVQCLEHTRWWLFPLRKLCVTGNHPLIDSSVESIIHIYIDYAHAESELLAYIHMHKSCV